jgi:ApeA N-terminal domain 1
MASDQLLKKRIGEEFDCVGEWWLPKGSDPANSEFKCFGTLTFSRDQGITLEIMGRLGGPKLPKNLVGEPAKMIWGKSEQGEVITLYECQNAGMTVGTVSTESYIVGSVFVSKKAWFTPGEGITFTSLTLQYTHLAEWVGLSGFQPPSLDEFNEFIKGNKAEIIYKRPNDLPQINVRGFSVSIGFGNSWPSVGPAIQKATIEQYTSIFVKPRSSKEITLDEALILARGIQNFLSLVMYDTPIYPLVIEGTVRIEKKASEKEPHATMQLLYAPIATKKPSEKITSRDIVFSYRDVADILEGALNRMVIVEGDKLKLAFSEFFAEYFTPPEFTEDQFIAILRVLEALQRRTREKDYYMSKEEYSETLLKKLNEPINKALLNGDIQEDFHESLKKQLSYGYQYSLSARLDDLFATYGTEFLKLFIQKNKSDFIREIVATYNWLVHADPEYRDDALDRGAEFGLLNLRLQLFGIAVLLHYIGIPLEKVEKMFKLYKFDFLRPQ